MQGAVKRDTVKNILARHVHTPEHLPHKQIQKYRVYIVCDRISQSTSTCHILVCLVVVTQDSSAAPAS